MNENNKIDTKNTTPEQLPKEGVVGPIIGSTIIILLIVLGGLYFWSFLVEKRQDTSEIKDSENLEIEVKSLEQEISNDELDKIDQDIIQIENELNAEMDALDQKIELE